MTPEAWIQIATRALPDPVVQRLSAEYHAHWQDALADGLEGDMTALLGDARQVNRKLRQHYLSRDELAALINQAQSTAQPEVTTALKHVVHLKPFGAADVVLGGLFGVLCATNLLLLGDGPRFPLVALAFIGLLALMWRTERAFRPTLDRNGLRHFLDLNVRGMALGSVVVTMVLVNPSAWWLGLTLCSAALVWRNTALERRILLTLREVGQD